MISGEPYHGLEVPPPRGLWYTPSSVICSAPTQNLSSACLGLSESVHNVSDIVSRKTAQCYLTPVEPEQPMKYYALQDLYVSTQLLSANWSLPACHLEWTSSSWKVTWPDWRTRQCRLAFQVSCRHWCDAIPPHFWVSADLLVAQAHQLLRQRAPRASQSRALHPLPSNLLPSHILLRNVILTTGCHNLLGHLLLYSDGCNISCLWCESQLPRPHKRRTLGNS